jgi:hypothetical protein
MLEVMTGLGEYCFNRIRIELKKAVRATMLEGVDCPQ